MSAASVYRLPFLAALLVICCAFQANNRVWSAHDSFLHRHTVPQMVAPTYEPYFIHLARVLKPALRSDDILSSEVLGFFSYELLNNPVHDWLGLVDSHIAHHATVVYPRFGKADPAYSVDVVAPTLFAFDSGPQTLQMFQAQTKGRFGQKYGFWQVTGQPVILALRRDREQDIVAVLRKENLPLQPLL